MLQSTTYTNLMTELPITRKMLLATQWGEMKVSCVSKGMFAISFFPDFGNKKSFFEGYFNIAYCNDATITIETVWETILKTPIILGEEDGGDVQRKMIQHLRDLGYIVYTLDLQTDLYPEG